ncbi:hypothetical protein CRE_01290 [Caenorhabditis remanei]|uniref:Uncharacterized protein n=1 Tax=Caenorhabditis remanei TaxID=31234 RepID=E3N9S8_CAERE|nr:hypothetical protein CRE_01290 [Caenorhabditis remanei]
MSTQENCTVENCYQCLTNKYWKMQDDLINTRVRLSNCENEKQRLEAQLATGKSEIRRLEARLNNAITAIGYNEKKIEKLERELNVASQKESELQVQHATVMIKKNLVIQELEIKLVASKELQEQQNLKVLELSGVQKKSCEKIQELESKLSDNNLTIQDLKIQLSAAPHQCANKIMELQVRHDKELNDKDQVIQKLETHLTTVQEQHSKAINAKDLEIQQLAIKLVGSLEENVENIKEVNRQQSRIQKLQEESTETERRLQDLVEMLKGLVQQKEKEVVSEPSDVHIELGKLYMELQEAKKSQEALVAAKDKEIEDLTKQHEANTSESAEYDLESEELKFKN